MNPIKTLLADFDDDHKFSIGTYIRIYGVNDLAAKNENDDYYEYMIADIPGESKYHLITNVSREITVFKSGYALCFVNTINGSYAVSGEELKRKIGIEKTFIVKY